MSGPTLYDSIEPYRLLGSSAPLRDSPSFGLSLNPSEELAFSFTQKHFYEKGKKHFGRIRSAIGRIRRIRLQGFQKH